MVCGGASALSCLVGFVLAFCVELLQIPGRKWFRLFICSFVLLPLYVQAIAWSAGFGNQGWLRWNQVTAASSSGYAIAACIWIHGSASLPISFCLLSIALGRAADRVYQMAIIEGPPISAFFHVLLPRAVPWIACNFLLIFVLANSDMIITNLFQVPTLTEVLYQQVQFDRVKSVPVAIALAYAFVLAVLSGILLGRLRGFRWSPLSFSRTESHVLHGLGYRLLAWIVAVGLVVVFFVIPIMSLVVKSGWQVTIVDSEIVRQWRMNATIQSFGTIQSFRQECAWSLLLSFYSLILTIGLALWLILLAQRSSMSAMVWGIVAFSLALPGPIINLLLQSILVNQPGVLGVITERTLLAPIVALQFRTVPFAFGLLWLSVVRFQSRYSNVLAIDALAYFKHWRAFAKTLVLVSFVVFFISFANLETYLLVLPPGVTTLSLRMFELLHYGTQNKESVLALTLVFASSLIGFAVLRLGDYLQR